MIWNCWHDHIRHSYCRYGEWDTRPSALGKDSKWYDPGMHLIETGHDVRECNCP